MFRNSRTTNWLALATLPVSEINATRNQLIAVMAFLSILILAALVVLIISMIRRITRPLADKRQDAGLSRVICRGISKYGERTRSGVWQTASVHPPVIKGYDRDISHILEEISGGNLDLR